MIEASCNKLIEYIDVNSFKGFDPYDTLNSYLPFHYLGKWGPALAIQFQKRNPINIRTAIGIKKDYNPKAMGLLLKSFSAFYKLTKNKTYLENAEFLFNWLRDNYSRGYHGHCWGYNFDWATPGSYLKKYTPSVVVTAFVVDGIIEYYKLTYSSEARKIVESSCDFIIKDLLITNFDEGVNISYTPKSDGCCYNASLLGAETLAKAYWLTGDESYIEIAKKAVSLVLSKQKSNGKWYYSFNPDTGKERKQIDFHQGFILMSLYNYQKYSGMKDTSVQTAIEKGCDYYFNNQFFADGRSKWRLPKVWPVEIHNQAQGIITFSRLKYLNENYFSFAKKILKWTIQNMQDDKGFFYYQKHRLYMNKNSYMRWAQAWMLLAFATFKEESNE